MTATHRLLAPALALLAGCSLLNDPTKLEPGPDTAGPAKPTSNGPCTGQPRSCLRLASSLACSRPTTSSAGWNSPVCR